MVNLLDILGVKKYKLVKITKGNGEHGFQVRRRFDNLFLHIVYGYSFIVSCSKKEIAEDYIKNALGTEIIKKETIKYF